MNTYLDGKIENQELELEHKKEIKRLAEKAYKGALETQLITEDEFDKLCLHFAVTPRIKS